MKVNGEQVQSPLAFEEVASRLRLTGSAELFVSESEDDQKEFDKLVLGPSGRADGNERLSSRIARIISKQLGVREEEVKCVVEWSEGLKLDLSMAS